MADSKQEWPKITPEERIQHETLFYSQGPLDGFLTGEKARDVFLKSGLPLQVLSQIWNLADVSNDNLLNVHEFVLAMHLTLGVIQGLKPPIPLPRYLTPPTSDMLNSPLQETEKDAYKKIFKLLDKSNSGFIEAEMAHDVFNLSGLPADQLAQIWDIADLNRDGSLDPEEWMVACHLIRTVKKGQSLNCPVNVYSYLPDRVAPNSLQARKQRVDEYELKKQRLMALKEKRKQDVNREAKRLELAEEKLKICRDLYHCLRKAGKSTVSAEEFKSKVASENAEITKQEEIVYRLKKEHEKVRQNTVKIILEEQKLNDDIRLLKRGTDELNKKLRAIHTKATKDPDPFHQLYEQIKEKKLTVADVDVEEIYMPFTFDPFDKKNTSQKLTSGEHIFVNCDRANNNHKINSEIPEKVAISFKNIDDSFTDIWGTSSTQKMNNTEEEDTVFKQAKPSALEDDSWFRLHLSGDSLVGDDSKNFADLQRKLVDLKNEIQKLNMEGDRLVFRNPEDYTARKRAREEEERSERLRHQRRGANGKENVKRHTLTSKPDEATQAAREYRIKRRSLNLEGGKPDPNRESPLPLRRSVEISPSRPSRGKRFSTESKSSVDEEKISEDTPKKSVVEKLDFSSLDNENDTQTESLKSPERALKENNFQETVQAKVEVTSTPKSSLSKSPESSEPDSPTKSQPKSSGKKTRAPPPPCSGATSPTSPKSSESQFKFQESTKVSKTAESVTVEIRNSTEVAKSTSAAVETSVEVKQEAKPTAQKATVSKTSSASVTVANNAAPIAPPRRKKKGSVKSNSGQTVSSPDSTPRKEDVKSPRNSEILTVGSTSFNSTLEDSPNRPGTSPRTTLVADSSFEVSKEKPVILSDSLESEIFGALKGSKLFNDSESSSFETVTTSFVTEKSSKVDQKRVSSPPTEVVVSKKYTENSTQPTGSVRTERVVKDNQRSEPFDVDSVVVNSHGGARPKVREPVKQELPERTTLRSKITREQRVEEPEEEEIETIIEEVIEIKTKLDEAGNPILDTSDPRYQSQVISSKKTVFSQAIEPLGNRTEESSIQEKRQSTKLEEKPTLEKSKSPKQKAPAPPVPSNQVSATSKIEASPSSTPPSVRVKDKSKRSSIPDYLSGGAAPGYESDASDASSVPPPLPDSAPPALPAEGPPGVSGEEMVELEFKTHSLTSQSSTGNMDSLLDLDTNNIASSLDRVVSLSSERSPRPIIGKMDPLVDDRLPALDIDTDEEVSSFVGNKDPLVDINGRIFSSIGNIDDTQSSTGNMDSLIDLDTQKSLESSGESSQGKTTAQMRADFFGLKPSRLELDEVETSNSGLEAYFSEMRKLDGGKQLSDGSDEESGFSATFSPGDSGILVSSLPTSPDESDGRSVNLISYQNKKKGGNLDITSSYDSAYDETTSPYDLDTRGDNQHQYESGVLSPRSKVQDPTILVDKARQFAEIVQKPNFVVKRETSNEDDFDQDRLQELELQRRAVISQSTVRKKFGVSSPTDESLPPFYEESTAPTETEKQHWVLEDNSNPSPEAAWSGRPNSVNLYSENVLQEQETTEVVDRESIRDLSSTRQQWETILTPLVNKQESDKKQPSGSVRHWEVNFPNKKRPVSIDIERVDIDGQDKEMADTDVSTESAIEREIRMNMEREANLRKEQEERQKLIERQKGKVDTTMYENVPKEEVKQSFHELTEADRGSELWKRETIIQQELREQEEKEKALRKNYGSHVSQNEEPQSNGVSEETTESIIEKEIRIQREREAELLKQRTSGRGSQAEAKPQPEAAPEESRSIPEAQNDINHNQTKSVSYETAISSFHHEGESLIARELREAREREEELQKQRERLNQVSISSPSAPEQQTQPQTQTQTQTPTSSKSAPRVNMTPVRGTWQKDVSPFLQKSKRSGSVDSLASSHSTGQTPSDAATPNQEEDDFMEYKPKSETPIEREIRLARERENELRRSKGLPEIPEPKVERTGPPTTPVTSNDTPRYMRSYGGDSSNSMKKYSSSRLQQEIIKQNQRELALRNEGKIITTSQEHIEPLKYVAVTGQETTNAAVKKNFVTRRMSGAFPPAKPIDEVDGPPVSESPVANTTPKSELLKNRKAVTSGGAGFSYKESRNTAESKIERELREMREREEELKKQRSRIEVGTQKQEETANGSL